MLADAAKASFQFHATRADLEHVLVLDLNKVSRRYGVAIKKADLQLTTPDDRTVDQH